MAIAYRNVEIHPDDLPLLGVKWCGLCHHYRPGRWFKIMMSHSSIITWTISAPWAHQLPLSATATFKLVFNCVKNLAYPFIQLSWRDPRLILQSLGLNLTLEIFRFAFQLIRVIRLLHC